MESELLALVMDEIEGVPETPVSSASSRRNRVGSYICNEITFPTARTVSSV